ncbi:hypothetical protein QR680_015989 [Steinernema hermaphroditum]|uniref:7TM GPCR serpentine receptor class x (Srx) domain-containing protein n=1 Tax=Steinernema hermaphroditum TaxID=289476 RepID=A0AA39HAL3_9BILA|nr:hypothetical protein QR680_015989 [Steinernema hermaphroditum]
MDSSVLLWIVLDRDIRFFAQTSVQNLTMIFATLVIVLANNRNHGENKLLHIFGFNALLLTYVNNALSLVLFNPEVRSKIVSRIREVTRNCALKEYDLCMSCETINCRGAM